MEANDTVRLLRECDAGAKMGAASIGDVLGYVRDDALKRRLTESRQSHERLCRRILEQLDAHGDGGKEPNPVAKGMSWIKTNLALAMDVSDATIADLMTDGCNMGVKSLSRYLNQYPAADAHSRELAWELVSLEEELAAGVREYL